MAFHLSNFKGAAGQATSVTIESKENHTIDGKGQLLLIPALIDPHVHFRTPGAEHKENWITGAKAAVAGGISAVFDMPNTSPTTITLERLEEKRQLVEQQLEEVGIPLRAHFFLGADKDHFSEIARCKEKIIGLKIFMGSSTGDLLMDDDAAIEEAFRLAAENDLMVAVHAEEESIIAEQKEKLFYQGAPAAIHSQIRDPSAAATAVEKAIGFAKKHKAKLYVLHLSTKAELDLIRKGKREGVKVYCEVTPHHLFLDTSAYKEWGTLVQMNPPLRTPEDRKALWQGIHDGTVDSIGTDHAPHTLEEKRQPYGKAPSGVPGIETILPLFLDACHKGHLTYQKLVELTNTNVKRLYMLPDRNDYVLIDENLTLPVSQEHLLTKCGWSPYAGWNLTGWPLATVIQGRVFPNLYTCEKSHVSECITPVVASV